MICNCNFTNGCASSSGGLSISYYPHNHCSISNTYNEAMDQGGGLYIEDSFGDQLSSSFDSFEIKHFLGKKLFLGKEE